MREKLRLYGILGCSGIPHLMIRMVESAIEGGMTMFQLREKKLSHDELLETAVALNKLCKKHRIPFIVNDSVELCLKADADGVHLGQEDGSLTEARKILGPSKIIGATAHNLEEALRAESEGADYIGVGAAFGSKTKMVSGAIDLNEYNRITQQVHIPVVAIGGIHAGNIDALYDRGISGVSVISAIFGDSHTSPEKIRDNALVLHRLAEHL